MLVVQFLNLVTGAHSNAKTFWTEVLPDAMTYRFGKLILHAAPQWTAHTRLGSGSESGSGSGSSQGLNTDTGGIPDYSPGSQPMISLWQWCTSDPTFMFTLLPQLCSMTGIHLSTECKKQLTDFEELLNGPITDRTGSTTSYDHNDSGYNVTNITDTYRFHNSGSRTYHSTNQQNRRQVPHFEFVMADITEIQPVSTCSFIYSSKTFQNPEFFHFLVIFFSYV